MAGPLPHQLNHYSIALASGFRQGKPLRERCMNSIDGIHYRQRAGRYGSLQLSVSGLKLPDLRQGADGAAN
jgi:hypothetical protein